MRYFVVPDKSEFLSACALLDIQAQLRVQYALGLMTGVHSDQALRLTGHHYSNHPIEVATSLINDFGCKDPNLIIIALLHDIIEDQSAKLAGFTADRFDNLNNAGSVLEYLLTDEILDGEYIASGVRELSNSKPRASDTRTKEQRYLDHIRQLFRRHPEFALVKCADIKQNAFRLEEINNSEKRLARARKYKPVLEFIREEILLYKDIMTHPLRAAADSFLPELENQLSTWDERFGSSD